MTIRSILLPLLALVALQALCASRKSTSDPTVMTIAGKPVSLSEFEYLYRKNASQQVEQKSLDEYVEMFVNYKLKVADAEAAGIDTTAAFVKEFTTYRDEIAAPYLMDRDMADSLRRAAISHYAVNVDVSHIMLPLDAPAAYVDSIYRALMAGADFADAARSLSVDRLSSQSGGRIGFIAAGRYPYAFEDAAFATEPGAIAPPVASHAGIHIIKVNSRRPDIGQIKVRHILKLTQGADSSGIASRRAAIDSIARLLTAGADFAAIAKAETDDPSGRAKGGALPWFGAGMMVPQFEAAAFSLAPGEMSAVVETPYGFHIILCDDRRPSLPDDEIASQVDAAMEADGRTDMARRRFMERFIASHPDLADASPDRLAAAATELLPSLSPDFRNLISEYRDGMLLYEISNRMVWGRAADDPSGLNDFFEANRDRYSFDSPKFKGYIIQATSDSLAAAAHQWLEARADSIIPANYGRALREQFGGRDVRIDRVLAAKGDNKLIDHLIWGAPKPGQDTKWTAFLTFGGRVIDRPEEAADVRAAATADWQQQLDRQWIASLRSRYDVKINRKALRSVAPSDTPPPLPIGASASWLVQPGCRCALLRGLRSRSKQPQIWWRTVILPF